jgi:two-component system sensor histidine kinase BaeS
MIQFLRSHLGAKFFLTYLVVMLIGALVLISVVQLSLPTAFNRHMAGMGLGADGMMAGRGFGPGNGGTAGQGGNAAQILFGDFRAGVNEALFWSVLAAGGFALLVSLFMSRSLVAPLRAMTAASQRIADGTYSERVRVGTEDELGQLAAQFNRMANKLEQTESLRRRLIGDVAHELRTPLTTIQGSAEGLIDGVLPANQKTYQQIYREAERLGRLVDDLQELSRVEAGAFPLDLQPVAPSSLVSAVIERLRHQFDEKGVALVSAVPPDLPPVLVDEDRIGQVLVNLVGNALAYTSPGGRVEVAACLDGKQVQFSVSDDGIGISAEHLPHLFERFYRVDKSRARRAGGGSGIGLTIARHLVEAHAGRIWAESEGEGRGSRILFVLPSAAR